MTCNQHSTKTTSSKFYTYVYKPYLYLRQYTLYNYFLRGLGYSIPLCSAPNLAKSVPIDVNWSYSLEIQSVLGRAQSQFEQYLLVECDCFKKCYRVVNRPFQLTISAHPYNITVVCAISGVHGRGVIVRCIVERQRRGGRHPYSIVRSRPFQERTIAWANYKHVK